MNSGTRAHALLSASSATRWLACPPSARLEEKFPDTTSDFAKEGTLAHELAELKLRKYAVEPMTQRAYSIKANKLKRQELWQPEMDEHTETYLDYIKGVMLSYPVKPYVTAEKQVDFSRFVPEGFGTADCLILAGDKLHVIDFKYGKGVHVSAEDNPQMKLYALGALEGYRLVYDVKTVQMTIVQPRLNNISEFEISAAELLDWGTAVNTIAVKAYAGEGDFNPGEHCRFCRAKAQCKARADLNMQLYPAAEQKCDPALLSAEELGEYLRRGKLIAAWVSDLESFALAHCLNGHNVPGFKAVEGRTTRAFTNTDEAFSVLMAAGIDEAMLYERKPLTLAQTEKVVGKAKFTELASKYVVYNPGKPTLVPESDKREAISTAINAADVFNKLEA